MARSGLFSLMVSTFILEHGSLATIHFGVVLSQKARALDQITAEEKLKPQEINIDDSNASDLMLLSTKFS